MDPVSLEPSEVVPGRPFTDPALTGEDVAMLGHMLEDLRGVLEEVEVPPAELIPYHQVAWRVHGRSHRLIVCNEERLRTHPALCIVGFFGDRRTNLDIGPLEQANAAVVAEFHEYPGILSYSSTSLDTGQWGNMVLHEEPMDAERWRQSEKHADAVDTLSPVHYRCVRIHNAGLTSGLFDDPEVAVMRTKYFDFTGDSEWRGLRTMVESPAP